MPDKLSTKVIGGIIDHCSVGFVLRVQARAELAAILKRDEELEAQLAVMWDLVERGQDLARYALTLRDDRPVWGEYGDVLGYWQTPEWLEGLGELALPLAQEPALTPDAGKRVVDVELLQVIRNVLLLAMLDDGDSRGVYPKDSTVGDVVDKLAALIGEGE